ncbi:hypothetical protein VTO42DRAFT_7 [Malbranchea cinnamomea]
MTSTTTNDPYAVLGVSKDATAAEIRSAYKKLVLKCHPDKILDESKRSQAQDEFQRVQEAYELLSDETKRARYDQKVQYAEARKPAASPEKSSDTATFRTSSKYEYRGGKLYEEKTFFRVYDDDDEELRVSSRKYETYERKQTTRESDEKKKNRSSESKKETSRSMKEKLRDSLRSSRSDRAKTRDKERRREQSEKRSRTVYIPSDDDTESDRGYDRTKSSKSKATYESPRKEKPSKYESPKYVYIEDSAFDYIQRSKASEHERRPSASFLSPHSVYYQKVNGDTARRSSARPVRRDPARASIDREPLFDDLRGSTASRKPASPTPPTSIRLAAGVRATSAQPTRVSTYSVRTVKEMPTLRRAETAPLSSTTSRRPETTTRSSRRDRYDSGYSSPGTPDMSGTSPPKSSKFTIVEEDDEYFSGHRTVVFDGYKRHQSVSPTRRARVTPVTIRATSRPAQSRAREVPVIRTESSRTVPSARTSPLPSRRGSTRDGLFGEVSSDDYFQRFPPEQVRFSPKIRQEDISFSHKVPYRPPILTKGSYAY